MFNKKENYDEQYDAIVVKYNKLALLSDKASPLLQELSKRYRLAIADKMDLGSFLKDEEYFVDSLLLKEETLRKTQALQQEQRELRVSALDAQMALRDRATACYQPITIEGSDNEELMRLFGAIDALDRQHWSAISKYLKEVFPLRANSPLEVMENQLWSMLAGQQGKPPQALAYYADCIRRVDPQKTDDAAFGAIKEASFFLNDLSDLLVRVNFPADNEAMVYLQELIDNFRLRDIKRKKEVMEGRF